MLVTSEMRCANAGSILTLVHPTGLYTMLARQSPSQFCRLAIEDVVCASQRAMIPLDLADAVMRLDGHFSVFITMCCAIYQKSAKAKFLPPACTIQSTATWPEVSVDSTRAACPRGHRFSASGIQGSELLGKRSLHQRHLGVICRRCA